MNFNKKSLLGLCLLFSLTIFLAACGGGGDDAAEGNNDGGDNASENNNNEGSDGAAEIEAQTWRFVTEEIDGQLQYEYAEEFGKRISEKTGGKITIEPYEFGGLGSEVDQVEQLQNGAVQMAIVSPGFTGTMVKEGQVFALHFLFPDSLETTQEILNTSEALNVDLADKYAEHDIRPLSYWVEGGMQWTSSGKPLKEPSDFEQFKMRTQTSPLIMKSYEAYGANPTPMSWGELYTALERNTVEGQENPIFFIEDASFHEVQDYMTLSNHNVYVAMTTVNPDFYNSLPDNVRQILDETVDEMQDWVFKTQAEMNDAGLQKIKDNTEFPTEIVELSEAQRDAFRNAAIPVRDFYREEVSTVEGAILDKLEQEIKDATK